MKSLNRHILQQIVSSSTQGILLIDARDSALTIAYANPAYERLSGYAATQIEGTSWHSILAGDAVDPELAKLRLAVGRGETCSATIAYYRKDGTTWSAEVSVQPLTGVRGDTCYFLCQHEVAVQRSKQVPNVQVDLLQRALGQARQKIASLDRMDPVSGLLKYESFLSALRRDLGIARRENRPLTAAVFEIVELEVYRQTFGNNAGDSCLRMIGAQIAGAFRRAGDMCARYDEATFVVAVPDQKPDEVIQIAARVVDKVRSLGLHNPRAQSGRYLTIRTAVVGAEVGTQDADALVQRAKTQALAGGKAELQQPA